MFDESLWMNGYIFDCVNNRELEVQQPIREELNIQQPVKVLFNNRTVGPTNLDGFPIACLIEPPSNYPTGGKGILAYKMRNMHYFFKNESNPHHSEKMTKRKIKNRPLLKGR